MSQVDGLDPAGLQVIGTAVLDIPQENSLERTHLIYLKIVEKVAEVIS